MDRDDWKKFIGILLIIFLALYPIYAIIRHNTELERDGFKVLEEHKTYTLVEKQGHQYIATETGMYSLDWEFEHYPECPCKNKK